MNTDVYRLGILISGRGSNMRAILKAAQSGKINAIPAVVISNKPDAPGLKTARSFGVPTSVIQSKNFHGTRDEYEHLIIEELIKHGVGSRNGIICLAGFMRILGGRGLLFDDVFYTGDICTRDRPGITGANIPKCRTLIMECTFGMPQFRFPPIDEIVEKTNQAISEMYSRGIPVILMGYEVGKVQTICKMFEHWKPLYYHERVKKINDVCRILGADVPDAPSFEEAEKSGMIQKCPWVLVAPMLSSSDKLVKRLKSEYNATTIGFSGWSAVPSHMLARRCDRMFPYSDHCDYTVIWI